MGARKDRVAARLAARRARRTTLVLNDESKHPSASVLGPAFRDETELEREVKELEAEWRDREAELAQIQAENEDSGEADRLRGEIERIEGEIARERTNRKDKR